jgi:hypothetical protein
MKHIDRIIRWGGLAAVLGLGWAIATDRTQAAETRPLTETGQEYVVTAVEPGSLPQDVFKQARERYGLEVWSGVLHQFIENSVGGKGSVVGFETVHLDASMPTGRIVFGWRSAVMANGDKLVSAGSFIPQTDGTLVADFRLVPELGTGRFAGATGAYTDLRPIPGGFVAKGTITLITPRTPSE